MSETMRPAPIDESGNAVCSPDCANLFVTEIEGRRWTAPAVVGRRVYRHCYKCGRPVGLDADGNPLVGLSYAELEAERDHLRRAALLLAESSPRRIKMRRGPIPKTADVLRDALAATEPEESADEGS